MKMTRKTAMNILSKRAVLGVTAVDDVQITNVSFEDENGNPFTWEEGSESEGEPYAIVNVNAMNEYGKAKAQKLFSEGKYQEACNQNLSARVSIKQGRELANAFSCSVKTELREVKVKDEDGEPTGETEMAVLIAKIKPTHNKSADDFRMKDFDFGEEEDDTSEGAPEPQRSTVTTEDESEN